MTRRQPAPSNRVVAPTILRRDSALWVREVFQLGLPSRMLAENQICYVFAFADFGRLPVGGRNVDFASVGLSWHDWQRRLLDGCHSAADFDRGCYRVRSGLHRTEEGAQASTRARRQESKTASLRKSGPRRPRALGSEFARGLALCPVHFELSRCGGSARGAGRFFNSRKRPREIWS